MLLKKQTPKSIRVQYDKFDKKTVISSKILTFKGVDEFDVYNPTIPFKLNGKTYIAGRVEKRSDTFAEIKFFEEKKGYYELVESTHLALQDPFITTIDNEIILGGVNYNIYISENEKICRTDFYKVKSLADIEYLMSGPNYMKDIRLVQLPSKEIGIFSRPQGPKFEKENKAITKIGFTVVKRLEDITPEIIEKATYLETQFLSNEWGGTNQAIMLKNGLIGVIGHKSYLSYENGEKQVHYYGTAFVINPKTGYFSEEKVIISKDCFPSVCPKKKELLDVVFPSGIIRNNDGTSYLYSGVSDSCVGVTLINDPFIIYEETDN